MTDYKKLASEFMDMFASRLDVRGQTVNKGIRREDGKEEVNVEFMFEKITEEHWELHLKTNYLCPEKQQTIVENTIRHYLLWFRFSAYKTWHA